MVKVIFVLAYLIFAPFLGALLDGVDRIISARMQRRKGPKLLQPFYDLGKLFSKERIGVNDVQLFFKYELSGDSYDRRKYALRGSGSFDGTFYFKYCGHVSDNGSVQRFLSIFQYGFQQRNAADDGL